MAGRVHCPIVHIVCDEKFIDCASELFETVSPGSNCFILPGKLRELVYIRKTPIQFCGEQELCSLIASGSTKAVVFHGLNACSFHLFPSIHPGAKVVWLGWGADYYDWLLSSYYPDGLILPRTLETARQIDRESRKSIIERLWLRGLNSLNFLRVVRKPDATSVLRRIDFFIPVLKREYEMARAANPDLRASYVPWNYQDQGSPMFPEAQAVASACGSRLDILIGNSATFTNNHIDVLEWLFKSNSVKGRRLIVPLNYGCKRYAKRVMEAGHAYFGDLFQPITEWMPEEEYFHLLRNCGTGMFGHLRQQGGGNANFLLKWGNRVYLHSKSPLFRELKDNGAHISAIDDFMSRGAPADLSPLCPDEAAENRRVASLMTDWGPEYPRTRRLVEVLLS